MPVSDSNFRFNFLARPLVQRIVRTWVFPYALQVAVLVALVYLMLNGIRAGITHLSGGELPASSETANLTTLVVWGLWWPVLILMTLLLGRVWCTVCPVELVTNIANRLARLMEYQGLALPKWARAGFLILISYIILELLVSGLGAQESAVVTAFVLLGLLAVGAVVGLVFREPHAFCKGFCPLGLFFNIYSRLTPVSLRNDRDDVCAQCPR